MGNSDVNRTAGFVATNNGLISSVLFGAINSELTSEEYGIAFRKGSDAVNYVNKAINELKETVGIKKTIKDYGVDEKAFLDNLDEMTEQAFDDQCTGANPRYPLMKEMKQIFLDAFEGIV